MAELDTKQTKSYCCYVFAFCTKYKYPLLTDEVSPYVKSMIYQLQKNKFSVIDLTIQKDTVILKVKASPLASPYGLIQHIKRQTATMIKEEFPELSRRLPNIWTRSSYISTVGEINKNEIYHFIENQKKRYAK